VSASVQLGLLLALATAFVSILGFLYKQRGAASIPPIEWRSPGGAVRALFSNRWFVLGIVVAMASWGFHVAALALAPISLVQSVIAGGLVLLTVMADRLFGLEVTRREWIGVALCAAGLAFLAATVGDTAHDKHSHYTGSTLASYDVVLVAASLLLMVLAHRRGDPTGLLLAVAAGLQWGASDVTIKALSDHLGSAGVGVLIDPLALVILVLSLVGMVVSARSLQVGDAVPVIAATSAAANLTTIASGLVVFGEPLPAGTLGVVARLGAFALVVVAAFLTPGPAAGQNASPAEP
jgi:drug/metabolite transporter (DMT)-like permease